MRIKLLIVMAMIFTGITLQAQTAEEVLDEYYKAIGGKERFDAIKSFHLIGSSKLGVNEPGEFQFIYVRPERLKVKTVIDTFNIVQCVNENMGWQIVPPQGITVPTKMDETQRLKVLAQKALVLGPFYDYKEKGATLSYDGKVKKDDKVYKKLVLQTKDNGPKTTVYLDDTTNLIAIIEAQTMSGGSPVTYVNLLTLYKDIDGFMFPFSFTSLVNGKQYTRLELDNVVLNRDYDDSIFAIPEKSEQ